MHLKYRNLFLDFIFVVYSKLRKITKKLIKWFIRLTFYLSLCYKCSNDRYEIIYLQRLIFVKFKVPNIICCSEKAQDTFQLVTGPHLPPILP